MSDQGVYMDVEAVQGVADSFSTMGDVMNGVSQALEVAIALLKATAFFGMVGNMAMAMWLEGIKPNVDTLANKFSDLNMDIIGAIVNYRDGDNSGSNRFR